MLTNLRERSQGSFLLLILFGLLTFIFIFFFGPQADGCQPSQLNTSLDGWAARVNGVEVPRREIENLVYLRSDRKTEDQLKQLRQEVLINVVDQELLAQRALAIGINLDERGLSRYIGSDENPDFIAFTDDRGNFDPKAFKDTLRYRLGVTSDNYRVRKKREYLATQYRRFLEEQIQISNAEVQDAVAKDLRSWNLNYLKFSPGSYTVPEASEEAIKAFSTSGAEEIKAFYDKNKAQRYVKGREIKARRILIKKPADKAGQKAARAKIEDLYKQAKAPNADFAQLAAEHSEGAGDKEKSGDMGFVRPGAAFYKKVFQPLKVGEISSIQDESIGLFFVKAEGEVAAINRDLASVTAEIAKELLKSQAQSNQAKASAESAFAGIKSGASLADMAKPKPTPSADSVPADGDAPSAKPVNETAVVPLLAETGPITDGTPRFGQPWDRIPTLGARSLGARSETVARGMRTLTAEKPLLDQVVEIEGEFYIFSLKEKKEGSKKEIEEKIGDKRTLLLAQRRNQLIYGENAGFSGDPLAAFRVAIRKGQQVVINEELYPQPKAQANTGLPPGIKLELGDSNQ